MKTVEKNFDKYYNSYINKSNSNWKISYKEQAGDAMDIEVQIDATCIEPKIIIKTNKLNEEVQNIIDTLSSQRQPFISGTKDDKLQILEEKDIINVYAQGSKVFATTDEGEFELKLRLYEIETILDKNTFVRISKSEIINLKAVKNFDLSFIGTISVELKNGTVSYVSRRSVGKIKKILGV